MVELREAAEAEYPDIIAMTNRAFREPAGQADWKVETLIDGQRVDESLLRHQRRELIGWYERRGYTRTGETEPFPYGDDRFGRPTQAGLYFDVLEKAL